MRQDQANTEDETKVAHTVNQKSLHVGDNRCRPGIPKTDQQVRDETDRLPAEEQLHEIVAHDQHEHGKGKQRDVTEEAVVARIVTHIADRVDVNHQGHKRDHKHHGYRQLIDKEADLKPVIAGGKPLIDRPVKGIPGLDIVEDNDRKDESGGDPEDGRGMGEPARNQPTKQTRNRCADKRCQRHCQVNILHFHVSPSSCPDHPHGWF